MSVYLWQLAPCNIAGLSPFEDVDFESINLLSQFRAGSGLSFNVVDTRIYIEEIRKNESSSHAILPPSFLVALSYRPHDNTVLNVLSTRRISLSDGLGDLGGEDTTATARSDLDLASPDQQQGQQQSNDTTSTALSSSDSFASLLLSTGIVYLQPALGRYRVCHFTCISSKWSHKSPHVRPFLHISFMAAE